MIGIIREHNTLNGLRFSAIEYGLVAVGLGLLAGWYALVGRWVEAAAWFGIVANAAVVVMLAFAAIRRGEEDFGTFPMRHRAYRDRVARDHPGLDRRTTVLVVAGLVPYLIVVLSLADRARTSRP